MRTPAGSRSSFTSSGRTHSYVVKPVKLMQEGKPIGTLVILQDVTYLRDQDRARTNLLGTSLT